MSNTGLAKQLTFRVGIPIVMGISTLTVINLYFHHNVKYQTDEKTVLQKMDGIVDWTQVTIDKDGPVHVNRRHLLNWRDYTDKDNDGEVDRIYLGDNPFVRGSHSKSYYREEDLAKYPQVFQRADEDFRKQIKRFKPHINR
jgi:hypothetical protein